jgi:hypothetical protein
MNAMKQTTLTFFLSAALLCLSCQKDEPTTPATPAIPAAPNTLLNSQLTDLEGRYVGLVKRWIVLSNWNYTDTTWYIGIDTFTLRIESDSSGKWSFVANVPSPLNNGIGYLPLEHQRPSGNLSGGEVQFRYNTRVDPVYGRSDGTLGWLTVWRWPRRARGTFSHDPGPGRYGMEYEGVKLD